MGFPKRVNYQQAPAVAGDFASANPRASVVAGEGSLTAGPDGVVVGVFAWADPVTGQVSNVSTKGWKLGFVHREQQASITQWRAEYGNVVQAGQPITLMASGDYWVKFADGAMAGDKVYAAFADGTAKSGSGDLETIYTVTQTVEAGELAKISSFGA